MLQCVNFNDKPMKVDNEINAWFQEHPNAVVKFMTQSETYNPEYKVTYVTITILYEEK